MKLFMPELRVADLATSAAWYAAALGLVVEHADAANGFLLLAAPDGGRVALKQGTPTPGGVLLHFECSDLAAAVERLATAGVAVSPLKTSAEGYTRAHVSDPDGYAVVVFAWVS